MPWYDFIRNLFRRKSDPPPQPTVQNAPGAPILPPVAPTPVAAPSEPPRPVPPPPRPPPVDRPPRTAPAGTHWERNNAGWILVAGDAPLTGGPGSTRVYRISDTPYYLAKTGQASDPALSDMIDAWNASGAAARAWRRAASDFNGQFWGARPKIRGLLLEQYPAQTDDINWSSDSAEAENPGKAPFNG